VQLNKNRESQKDQLFLLRQEIRALKKLEQENEMPLKDTLLKKTAVLGDIKNLINDFKRERKNSNARTGAWNNTESTLKSARN